MGLNCCGTLRITCGHFVSRIKASQDSEPETDQLKTACSKPSLELEEAVST